jgi:hypothetical protein
MARRCYVGVRAWLAGWLIQALARAYTVGVRAASTGGSEAKEHAATHGFFALTWV